MTVNLIVRLDRSLAFEPSSLVDAAALATEIEEKVAALRVLGFDVVVGGPYSVPIGVETPRGVVDRPAFISGGKKPVRPYADNVEGFA